MIDRSTWQTARLFADLYDSALYDSPPEAEPDENDLPPLVIGTDASAGVTSGAWAWVDAEGRHDWGAAASRLIDACELEAIWQALRRAGKRDVVLLTDSRHALQYVRRPEVASGRVMDMALKVRHVATVRARDGRATRIAWMRGHAGIGVNEIAHRLALNALRQLSLGTATSVAAKVADAIVADLVDLAVPPLRSRWTLTFGAGRAGVAVGPAVAEGIASLDAGEGIEIPAGELREYLRERGRIATGRASSMIE